MPVLQITHPLRVPVIAVAIAPMPHPPPLPRAHRCPDCACEAALPDGTRRTCRACGASG